MKKLIFAAFAVILGATGAATAQTSVRALNFENMTYRLDEKPVRIVKGLQAGACADKDADGIPSGDIWNVSKETVAFGDLDGDGAEEAIVPLVANVCGGNMITNEEIVVIKLKAGKPSQMPKFDYFDEGCEAGKPGCNFARSAGANVRYDKALAALVVITRFATDDDAVCCPSLYRETWYKWNGTAFAESKKGKILKADQ